MEIQLIIIKLISFSHLKEIYQNFGCWYNVISSKNTIDAMNLTKTVDIVNGLPTLHNPFTGSGQQTFII